MSLRVFIDTGAWVALVDAADQNHSAALAKFEELSSSGCSLLTSDYVFDEAITLVRLRVSHAAAVVFGNSLLDSSVASVLEVDRNIRQTAWEIFKKYQDKDLSFTDCTSFSLMKKMGLGKAFTFDKHFRQRGFQLL
jgi:uncharacterized protein